MDNLEIWGKLQNTPEDAKKPIVAGRLKGFTDINPMFRFKRLTETFGPCGIGWKYTIDKLWLEPAGEEIKAFCQVSLYYKVDDVWNGPVPGLGGSSFIAKEKSGPYANDECYKMALSDAIGTACKALGMSADVYYAKDQTKYNTAPKNQRERGHGGSGSERGTQLQPPASVNPYTPPKCKVCGKEITDVKFKSGVVKKSAEIIKYTKDQYGQQMCYYCMKEAEKKGAS